MPAPIVPGVPPSAALANSNLTDSALLLLHDAVESFDTTGRWSSVAVGDLLSDLETACNLRGILIGAATKTETVVTSLLY